MSKNSAESALALEPFKNNDEFLDALQSVLESDYDTLLCGEALKTAGANINEFLGVFLRV